MYLNNLKTPYFLFSILYLRYVEAVDFCSVIMWSVKWKTNETSKTFISRLVDI